MIAKPSKLKDHHFWEMLNSRNQLFNREKFINKSQIKLHDHLIWWFNNNREYYVFETYSKEKIFFWQKKINVKKKNFYIGGWLSNKKKVNLIMVVYALRWQLKLNKKNSKDYDWIAVVKKNNKSVKKLTDFLGYKIVSKNNKNYELIKKIYKVSDKNYYYLYLKR
jgi:hypothetical protein